MALARRHSCGLSAKIHRLVGCSLPEPNSAPTLHSTTVTTRQSLQLNLPTVSIHDLDIHGDDLLVATHGRAFWILDNITPLRQAHDAVKAGGAYLYRPATAVRVDNDDFVSTPLPPEEPIANNPPNGAVVDYYLDATAAHIKLEIFDLGQTLVQSFSSDDPRVQHPPRPIAERWFPKPEILETTPGMHRFVWNLAWGNPGPKPAAQPSGDEYRSPRGPRAVPGAYQVRVTIDGKTLTQPLKIVMDPRSPATARDLEQQLQLGRQIFAEANSSLSKLWQRSGRCRNSCPSSNQSSIVITLS